MNTLGRTFLGMRATLSVAGALVAASPAAAADAVSIYFDWVPTGVYAAYYIGTKNGCFADKGINPTLNRGFGGVDTVTKVASGTGDFGVADLGSIMLAEVKSKAPVKAIMPIYHVSPMVVAVLADSPIQTLKDLEGRKLASAPGDAGIVLLPIAAKKAGVDFDKINRTSADPAALAGLLIQGKVDAITSYVTTAAVLRGVAQAAGKDLRLIEFGKDLDIYSNSLLTSDSMIKAKPGLVKRLRDAVECAYKATRDHTEEAIATMAAVVPGMDKAREMNSAKAGLQLIFGNPSFEKSGFAWDMDRVKRTLDVTKQSQGLRSDTDAASLVYQP
jgi:NitT/TauT family transport system substrate-binding protein